MTSPEVLNGLRSSRIGRLKYDCDADGVQILECACSKLNENLASVITQFGKEIVGDENQPLLETSLDCTIFDGDKSLTPYKLQMIHYLKSENIRIRGVFNEKVNEFERKFLAHHKRKKLFLLETDDQIQQPFESRSGSLLSIGDESPDISSETVLPDFDRVDDSDESSSTFEEEVSLDEEEVETQILPLSLTGQMVSGIAKRSEQLVDGFISAVDVEEKKEEVEKSEETRVNYIEDKKKHVRKQEIFNKEKSEKEVKEAYKSALDRLKSKMNAMKVIRSIGSINNVVIMVEKVMIKTESTAATDYHKATITLRKLFKELEKLESAAILQYAMAKESNRSSSKVDETIQVNTYDTKTVDQTTPITAPSTPSTVASDLPPPNVSRLFNFLDNTTSTDSGYTTVSRSMQPTTLSTPKFSSVRSLLEQKKVIPPSSVIPLAGLFPPSPAVQMENKSISTPSTKSDVLELNSEPIQERTASEHTSMPMTDNSRDLPVSTVELVISDDTPITSESSGEMPISTVELIDSEDISVASSSDNTQNESVMPDNFHGLIQPNRYLLYITAINKLQHMRKLSDDFADENKQVCIRLRNTIQTKLNLIVNWKPNETQPSRRERTEAVDLILEHIDHYKSLLNLEKEAFPFIALYMIQKFMRKVTDDESLIYTLAPIVLGLMAEVDDFQDVFISYFYSVCPAVVPYFQKSSEQSESNFKKQINYIRFFCTLLASAPPPVNGHRCCPIELDIAWTLISDLVNLPPVPTITASVLHELYLLCGQRLSVTYGSQWRKLDTLIRSDLLPLLNDVSHKNPQGRMALSRFEQTLKNTQQKGYVLPVNLINETFWVMSAL